jgi:hypothetical protein
MIFLLSQFTFFGQPKTSTEVLKKMHDTYSGKWYSSFTFNQTTENYRNDSLVKTATWYEAIKYPDNFRIDFGDPKDGNAVFFNRDSTYNFRKGKLGRVTANNDDLTFLLGGMYFYPFDSVRSKINRLGYHLDHFHMGSWKGSAVYIIGANHDKEKLNQLWIDKEKLVVVRFIKFEDGHKEEGILENHKRFGNGWSETAFTFYVDDKLFQKEIYHDCKAGVMIDNSFFDPKHFVGNSH